MLTIENVLFFLAFALLARKVWILLTWNRTRGAIVELVEDGERCFAPIVEFTANGQTYKFLHTVYKNPPDKIGAQIVVLYPTSEPSGAIIESFASLYLIPIVVFALGLVTLLLKPLVLPLRNFI
jgi:hypothetical protein